MNTRATILVLTMVLAGCSSSHDDRSTLATPQPTAAAPAASAAPSAVVAPKNAAFKAARAAAVESRNSTIPKIRDVPVSGATTVPNASPTAVVTPQSGASEAARAAAVESRSSTIPMVRGVPAKGVKISGGLPAGVPYASDKDPVQIVSYVLSSTIIHPGDKVTGDVVTSSNAASVTAQVGAFTVAVPKIAPGRFHLLMQLPSMPLPPGAEKLIITAIRTDGMRTTREVPITVVQ